MSRALVVVESPAKAKTINKYLGKDFTVLASYGHVRDLVPKEGAVDPDDNYAMNYQVIDKNKKHVDAIAKAAKQADALYLATDLDREGEAISWHVAEILRERGLLEHKDVHRVVFSEITPRAIKGAIDTPRELSDDLINAQQARRALDYLVGFNLSPLLWRKVKPGLSAGRVQSPALRLIVEREREIEAFKPREYWTIEADLTKDEQAFAARLTEYNGKKLKQFDLHDEAGATAARKALLDAADGKLVARDIKRTERKRRPSPPFITSTLQQEASRKLGFTTKRTMQVAQQLYEGVAIGGQTQGLITYMRTDSVHLAPEAINSMRAVIAREYGDPAVPAKPNFYKTKAKNAQEAHEAIRPTDPTLMPRAIEQNLTQDQSRLYDLIWRRAVASQMAHAKMALVAVDFACGEGNTLRANGSTVVEPGFLAAYQDARKQGEDRLLPPIEKGEAITLREIRADQHFTEPPPRYSEASLVKALEEYGIGRPSTYASIISVLLAREYVELDKRRFTPTDIGRVVSTFLSDHFEQYVDYEFTANLEDELDEVARGEIEWVPLLDRFWSPLSSLIDDKQELARDEAIKDREIGTDPKSGRPIIARVGRYGPMVQIGSRDDEEKPRFASLRVGQSIETITLDEALDLFKLPRDLGETETGEEIAVNIGRYGPYVRFGKKFASLEDGDDPYTIGRERALELIAKKKAFDANRIIKSFEDSDIQVLRGRYGPYITDGKTNAKIPKDVEPEAVELELAQTLIEESAKRPKRGRRGAKKAGTKTEATAKAKPPAKSATKKAPAKKATKTKATKVSKRATPRAAKAAGSEKPASA